MGGPVKVHGAMGYGSGVGVGGGGRAKTMAAPAPAEPAAAPVLSLAPPRQDVSRRPAQRDDDGRSKRREHAAADEEGERQQPAGAGVVVTAGNSSGVSPTAALVEAVRAALAGDRGACALAAVRGGKSIRLRLTVDERGGIVRVELVAGDKAAEGCLQKALAGLSSATVARRAGATGTDGATGTVEITLGSRR